MFELVVVEAVTALVGLGIVWLGGPRLDHFLRRLGGRWQDVLDRRRRWLVLAAAVGFLAPVLYVALHGLPRPIVSDEFAHLVTADTFAHGRLSNQPHAQWRHFQALGILQQPAYIGKFPPGKALFLAAGQRLAGHPAVGLWIVAAAMAAAMAWCAAAVVPTGWALVASLVIVARYGVWSTWVQAYHGGAEIAVGGALLAGAGLRIVRSKGRPRRRYAVILGVAMGLLALGRPFEGLLASLACWAWIVWAWPRDTGRMAGAPALVRRLILPAGAAVAPFLLFLGMFHLRATESPWTFPHRLYSQQYASRSEFLFQDLRTPRFDEPAEIIGADLYFEGRYAAPGSPVVDVDEGWRRMSSLLLMTLGLPLVCVVVARGRQIWRHPEARFAVAVLLPVLASHWLVAGWWPRYSAPVMPLVILLGVLGLRSLDALRIGRSLAVVVVLCLVAGTAWGMAAPPRQMLWEQQRREIADGLVAAGGKHLVVVRYGPYHLAFWEWVYNGADLEAETVLWARDLGHRDGPGPADGSVADLVAAFPDRTPWILDVDAEYTPPGATPVQRLSPYRPPPEPLLAPDGAVE